MTNQEKNVQQCFPLTRTSFCISADDFFPELLTQQLEISPTAAWKKGQLRQDRGGNKYYEKHPNISVGQYTFSHWRYSTEYEQVYDIIQSISKVLEKFVPLTDTLIQSKTRCALSYQISIAMKRADGEEQSVFPGMILSKDVIEFADIIGAEISFDFEGMILS